MTTKYVPVRPRARRPRLRPALAGVLIGAAVLGGIGAAEGAHPHHHLAPVTVAHREQPHHQAARPVPHKHKAGSHHLLRSAYLLHRLVHVPYALRPHPFRRLFWRPRFRFFRRYR